MELLRTRDINIGFFGVQVLFDVNFELAAGEIHCLCGENGAGKSTLVKILTGIYSHYTGEVSIQGRAVRIGSARIARASGVFAVQQHRDLVPTLSAVENIFLGSEPAGKPARGRQRLDFPAMREQARQLTRRFEVELDLDRPVSELRLSEQGIVAICKALAADSRILLIDEASAPLDNTERQTLYRVLRTAAGGRQGDRLHLASPGRDLPHRPAGSPCCATGRSSRTTRVQDIDYDGLIAAMTGSEEAIPARREAGRLPLRRGAAAGAAPRGQ